MQIERTSAPDLVLTEMGERISRLRIDQNLTQAELADRAGIGLRTLQRLESGAAASQLSSLIKVCQALGLEQRLDALQGNFASQTREKAVRDILRVGTSAGGARAKALIAWNPTTNEIRSGQVDAGSGFDYWLLKFDGVSGNKDKELEDPKGYGVIEYAYYLMATAAQVQMSECRLLEENGRRHFITKRFDRHNGEKLHMQSLCALQHYDFNDAGAYAYEQAFLAIRQLGLGADAVEAQYRRMLFNVVARNQDDHVKNIAFLMNKAGQWSLSPAFDVIYSYNPAGAWTSAHQMSINGKRDAFTLADFEACAKTAGLKQGRWKTILEEVVAAVRRWPEFAAEAGVHEKQIQPIAQAHRVRFATA